MESGGVGKRSTQGLAVGWLLSARGSGDAAGRRWCGAPRRCCRASDPSPAGAPAPAPLQVWTGGGPGRSCAPPAALWRSLLSAQQATGKGLERRFRPMSSSPHALKGGGLWRAKAHFCHRAEHRKSPGESWFARAELGLRVSHRLAQSPEAGIAAVQHTHESAASLPALTQSLRPLAARVGRSREMCGGAHHRPEPLRTGYPVGSQCGIRDSRKLAQDFPYE